MTTRRRSFMDSAGAVITPSGRWWRLEFPAGTTPCQVQMSDLAGRAVRVLERRLRAVLHAQLREEMLHMELDGVVREAEPLRDLGVGEPRGDQAPDLALARRQVAGGTRGAAFDPRSEERRVGKGCRSRCCMDVG